MNFNEAERKVVKFLIENDSLDYGFWPFSPIARDTRLSRKEVRRACRSLARKGVTHFRAGLWTEEGEPAGSGYGLTREGYKMFTNGPAADDGR